MKILHVSLWPIERESIGGTEKYVISLSTALQRSSVDNEVLMLSGQQTDINGVGYNPVKFSSVSKLDEYSIEELFFRTFDATSLKQFSHKIKYDFAKFDVIHFNSLLFYFCATDSKRVFTLHENPDEFEQNWGDGSFSRISSIIRTSSTEKTVFVAPSQYYAEIFQKAFLANVSVIPHAFPKSFLQNYQIDQKKDDILKIFVPSRLEVKQKGQDFLLESLGLVKKEIPNIEVLFSGLDNQYQENIRYLEKIASKYNIKAKFKNLGIEDMMAEYAIADLVILPSRYESFGYSALESLFLGKKTVLSPIPTYKEISQGNSNAFLAEKMNTRSFAEAILLAASSGVKKVEPEWLKRYSYENWASKYIECYNNV